MAKTKALISCAVTAQLICVFVFAYVNIYLKSVTLIVSRNSFRMAVVYVYVSFICKICFNVYTGETQINDT